jgi:SagB-type dehydrogenase family enzyme
LIESSEKIFTLPKPHFKSTVSLEEALWNRRSRREFKPDPVSIEDIAQILWAAYGINQSGKGSISTSGRLKTTPSAGARYPLEIYLVAGNVTKIPLGLYKYLPRDHNLCRINDRDLRQGLWDAALRQDMILKAPACLLYTAIYRRMITRYGKRGRIRYVPMDVGHSAQNVYLQAAALNLGTCSVGAFNDEQVHNVLNLPEEEEPLYLMPVGYYYS